MNDTPTLPSRPYETAVLATQPAITRSAPRRRWCPRQAIATLLALLVLAASVREAAAAPPTSSQRRAFELRNLGLSRIETLQNNEALELFEELADDFPNEALGHANAALCELRLTNFDDALEAVERARALAPDRPDIALLEVNIYEAMGKLDKALEVAAAEVAKHPRDLKLLFVRANVLDTMRDRERRGELLDAWMALYDVAPTNLLVLLEAMPLAAQLERWDETARLAASLRSGYAMMPDRVSSALDEVEAAAAGDEKLAKRAYTRALIARNVLRATTRFRRDAEELRLPSLLGGGEEIVDFASDELRAVTTELARENRVTFAPFSEETVASVGGAVLLGNLAGDATPELVVFDNQYQPHVSSMSDPIAVDTRPTHGALEALSGEQLVDWDNDGDLDVVFVYSTPLDGSLQDTDSPTSRFWFYWSRNEGGTLSPRTLLHDTADNVAWATVAADIDHDGDLDLVWWSQSIAEGTDNRWETMLLINKGNGEAEVRSAGIEPHEFRPQAAVAADLNDDIAIDIAIATDRGIAVLMNNLDGTFELIPPGGNAGEPKHYVAVADYDHDGVFDIAQAGSPTRILAIPHESADDIRTLPDSDELVAADFDNDGWVDLLLRSGDSWTLHYNRGGEWTSEPVDPLNGMMKVSAADLDGDGDLDLAGGADRDTVRTLRNDGGNTNRWMQVVLEGRTQNDQKNNYFGIGSTIEAKAGELLVRTPVTNAVTHLGLGQRSAPDILRIIWTNGTPQSIFNPETNQRIDAEQVIIGSCPSLYTWDEEREMFVFATDVLWRSALGMYIMADINAHHLTSNDWFRLTAEQVGVKDGMWEMRYVMDLWETAYVDEIRLLVVDHPDDGGAIYTSEVTLPPPFPEFEFVRVSEPVGLAVARDERGVDHRAALVVRDKQYADTVRPTRYQGIAEETTLELVPERWPSSPEEPFRLILDGWLYPTDASINMAIEQHPDFVPMSPIIEARGADGVWHEIARPGFPSGKFKTVVVDLATKLPEGCDAVRVRTNFQIHWDAAFFAIGDGGYNDVRTTMLHPKTADLSWRGTHRMVWENGVGPFVFDYDDVDPAPRWLGQTGRFTRFGDVSWMLGARDDRYVVTGSGEQIALRFDPADAPPLPEGWRRDFIIFTDGWLKDANLNSLTGQTVEPYPFSEMSAFPPKDGERSSDPGFYEFLEETVTRERDAHREWRDGAPREIR